MSNEQGSGANSVVGVKRKAQDAETEDTDVKNEEAETEVNDPDVTQDAPPAVQEETAATDPDGREQTGVVEEETTEEEKKADDTAEVMIQKLGTALCAAIEAGAAAALTEMKKLQSEQPAETVASVINTPCKNEYDTMSPIAKVCCVMSRDRTGSNGLTEVLKEMMVAGGDPYNLKTITDSSLYTRINRYGSAMKYALGSADALEILLERTKDLSILRDMLQFDKALEIKTAAVRMLLKNHGLLPLKRRKLTPEEMVEYSEDPYGDDTIVESKQEMLDVEEMMRGATDEGLNNQPMPVFDESKDPEWSFSPETPDVALTDNSTTATSSLSWGMRTVFLNKPLLPSTGSYSVDFQTSGDGKVMIGIAQWGMDKTTRLGSIFPCSGFGFGCEGDRALHGRLHNLSPWPANAKVTMKVDFTAGSIDLAVNGKWRNATFSGHNLVAQGPWFAAVSLDGPASIKLLGVTHSAK